MFFFNFYIYIVRLLRIANMSKKIMFHLEFPIHASAHMLYQYFSETSCLDEWFADEVNSKGDVYTFTWDTVEEKATLLGYETQEYMRFRWLEDEGEDVYFEFKIEVDDLTKDVSLVITDFANEEDIEEQKLFWENQIEELKHTIGA